MKKTLLFIAGLFFLATLGMAQENPQVTLPLLGQVAPSFTAESTMGMIVFPNDQGYKWKIIFSHPADFTPVCSSELLEIAASQDDFKKLNTAILVVSTDNLETHKEWVKSLESLDYKNRKDLKIDFPLIDDNKRTIARQYGMIHPETNTTKDVRGVFIIDPNNKIRAIFYYPMNIGRNVDEIKRTILALQVADKNNVLTPANWQAGNDVMVPYVRKASEMESLRKSDPPDMYMVSWYMIFKKLQ
jgi:peroxiredoxin 2/4